MNKIQELATLCWQYVEKLFNSFTITIGSVGAMMGYICGIGNEGIWTILVFAMILDFMTGLMCGYLKQDLHSKVSFIGIFKKFLMVAFIAVSVLVDKYLIGTGTTCSKAMIFFYLANEALSLAENSAILGLPIPQSLKLALVKLRSVSESSQKEVEKLITNSVSNIATGVVDSALDKALGTTISVEVKGEINKEIQDIVENVVEKAVDTAVDLTVDTPVKQD